MQKKLVIFLLSYNRPEYVGEALDSIMSQSYIDFDLIVSENSPNDKITHLLQNHPWYKDIKIIKRSPSLAAVDHFNTILKEAQRYEYAMLFHDDDILMPEALSEMMRQFELNPNFVAVACNALIMKKSEKTKTILMPLNQESLQIRSASQLIKHYVFKYLSHAPFPSYIYKTSYLGETQIDLTEGGKYSDVSFLLKLAKKGPFCWVAKPLMYMRVHAENDSANLNLKHIAKLSLFFLKTSPQLVVYVAFYFAKQVGKKIKMALA